MSAKDAVLQAIHRLPDDVDFKEIADEVAFLAALRKAECDIDSGRLVSNEDVRSRLEAWTSN